MTSSPVSVSELPIIRLTPRADARRVRFGAPWVFASDVVLDRRTKKLAPGTIARLEDAERQFLAVVAVNPASKIAVRVLDRSEAAVIDGDWISAKIARAAALRARLYDAPYYRLVHAEADGMPGVVIDRFGDIAVVQPNAAWADARISDISSALQVLGIKSVLVNGMGRARSLEGLPEGREVLVGAVPDAPVEVPMNGAIYMADLTGGQKTGLFYDQRPNHTFAQRFAKGAKVLDVFSHVGGFGLAALAGGASEVTCVDGSAAALALAQDGAARMGGKVETRQGDAFEVMSAMAEAGETFDVVICDPPAFAPAKPALEAGLRAYERVARLAAPLVAPDGVLGLCSCSHAATLSKFRASSLRGVGRAGRSSQILYTGGAGPDHPTHPSLAESSYLKAMFLRLGSP